jgi:Domain of unknown function (DUF5680)
MDISKLNAFIVKAKRATYVGGGEKADASRLGSHDLTFQDSDWCYLDSYFGGRDFLGQEAVWLMGEPVWAMSYYGYILRPDLFDGERAGQTIKAALTAMYTEGRFLGGSAWALYGPVGGRCCAFQGQGGYPCSGCGSLCAGLFRRLGARIGLKAPSRPPSPGPSADAAGRLRPARSGRLCRTCPLQCRASCHCRPWKCAASIQVRCRSAWRP